MPAESRYKTVLYPTEVYFASLSFVLRASQIGVALLPSRSLLLATHATLPSSDDPSDRRSPGLIRPSLLCRRREECGETMSGCYPLAAYWGFFPKRSNASSRRPFLAADVSSDRSQARYVASAEGNTEGGGPRRRRRPPTRCPRDQADSSESCPQRPSRRVKGKPGIKPFHT